MEQQLQVQTGNTQVAHMQQFQTVEEFRIACQNFLTKLNSQPPQQSIGDTADGRGKTVSISHVEMTLDEYFFGLWDTENFKWSVISNEIVGSIDLTLLHPVYGQKIKRVGAAAIQIMMHAVPDEVKKDKQASSRWALDPSNKKSNALDMGFPKLKAECLKNAAQSLGKLLGRDLNRKQAQVDNYNPLIVPVDYEELKQLFELKLKVLNEDDRNNAERIINNQETSSYRKLRDLLKSK